MSATSPSARGPAAAASAATRAAGSPPAPAPGPGPVPAAPFPPEAMRARCDEVVARYPTKMAALLPILHLAQRHHGWISPEVQAGVARYLDLSDAHVRGVVTFYAMYHTEPAGRHELWVCRTLTCWLRGAGELTRRAREKAGLLRPDGSAARTSEDGRFTVMEMECLGLCEVAPAVFLDGEAHGEVTPERLEELMEGASA